MSFVQVIKLRTSKFDDVDAAHSEWVRATEGVRTTTRELICQDRDHPGEYWVIVEFPSYEDAMRNNDLPATATIARRMAELTDAPPEFVNLDVIRTD
jgi:hypothetical protein